MLARASLECSPLDELRYGGLVIDRRGREVLSDGHPLSLDEHCFDLLFELARQPERRRSPADLRDAVWGGTITDAAVRNAISRLRTEHVLLGDVADPVSGAPPHDGVTGPVTHTRLRLIVSVPAAGTREPITIRAPQIPGGELSC